MNTASSPPCYPAAAAAPRPSPQTLAELFFLLLKNFLKKLPISILMGIPLALIIWAVHTFLMVVINDGFNAGENRMLDMVLVLRGTFFSGNLFWMLFTGTLVAGLRDIFRQGLTASLRGMKNLTQRAFRSLRQPLGSSAHKLFWSGLAAAMFSGLVINPAAGFLIALILGMALNDPAQSFLFLVLRLGWSDLTRGSKLKPSGNFNPEKVSYALMGAGLGFMLIFVLVLLGISFSFVLALLSPKYLGGLKGFFSGIIPALVLLLVIVIVLMSWVKALGQTKLMLPLLMLAGQYLLMSSTAWADDGGWKECGSSFANWIKCQGAIEAIIRGGFPAVGSMIGVLLGNGMTGLLDQFDQWYNFSGVQQLDKSFKDMVNQKIKEGYWVRNYGVIEKSWNNTLWNEYLPWGHTGGQCGEFVEWGDGWSKDLVEKSLGPGAVLDKIYIEEASSAKGQGFTDWCDSWVPVNHTANLVVMPNGDRYVLDYWEAIGSGKEPHLMTEQEWLNKWKPLVGESDNVVQVGDVGGNTQYLKQQITDYGPEKGMENFRRMMKNDPAKAESLINSWRNKPW